MKLQRLPAILTILLRIMKLQRLRGEQINRLLLLFFTPKKVPDINNLLYL